jgi:hypothetical protein
MLVVVVELHVRAVQREGRVPRRLPNTAITVIIIIIIVTINAIITIKNAPHTI